MSALMISIGAQWAVLQSAAWVGMAVSYSLKTGSVSEGLSQTFDGEHPCPLCCAVKKGTDSEKKDPKQDAAKKKLELFANIEVVMTIPLSVRDDTPRAENQTAAAFAIEPLHQPPRSA